LEIHRGAKNQIGKPFKHHDHGLIIVEEEEDQVNKENQEAEELTRKLRRRINQLRAMREAHTPSKWAAFKVKINQGRWRAPVAFAFTAFLLWHYATRKTRGRRDD